MMAHQLSRRGGELHNQPEPTIRHNPDWNDQQKRYINSWVPLSLKTFAYSFGYIKCKLAILTALSCQASQAEDFFSVEFVSFYC